jgi:Outer membrane protein beta-barrel domain
LSNRILILLALCGLAASASAQSNFNRFNFTVGAGPGIGRGDVAGYVGNSFQGTVGGGVNFSRMFGADAEYMYYDLGFRPGVIQQQSLPGQSGNMQSVSLNMIVHAPLHGKWGAYGIFGGGFYHRSVSATSQFLPFLLPCQPAWRWWDLNCGVNGVIANPEGETLSSNSKDAGGFNYGGGLTYRLNHLYNSKLFIEWRYHRAYHSDGQTIVMPVTIGLRW